MAQKETHRINVSMRKKMKYLHCTIPLFKVNESIVFQLLYSFQFTKLTKRRLKNFLCNTAGKVSNK